MSLFCVYPVFHWGDIVKKVLLRVGGWEKYKKGGWSYMGVVYGKVAAGGLKLSAHYDFIIKIVFFLL